MSFWRNRKHPLPRFPEEVISTFRALCRVLSVEDIELVRKEVESAYIELHRQAENNPIIDLEKATQIERVCFLLLERYPELDNRKKALVVGAVRYFAAIEDPFSEAIFASGFDDDIQVINYVLEELGMEEHYIPFH